MFVHIKKYTPATKDRIRDVLQKYLTKHRMGDFSLRFMHCLDELLKNAIKANYKYALVCENIEQALARRKLPEKPPDLLRHRKSFNTYATLHGSVETASGIVRKALTQEYYLMNFRNKARKEKRTMTTEEIGRLRQFKELIHIRKLLRQYDLKVHLRVEVFGNFLEIEVVNNAPILDADLKRIHEKRERFNELAERGEELLFFTEFLDESESGAGLGYATIDASLRAMNLDPLATLNIFSLINTAVSISIDRRRIAPERLQPRERAEATLSL